MSKISIVSLVVLLAGTVTANPAKEKMFSRMDTDKNDKVAQTEYLILFEYAFRNMDKNKDGMLDNIEFTHAAFKHIDTDKDGKIDPVEDKAFREKSFLQLDINADGVLTREEFIQ